MGLLGAGLGIASSLLSIGVESADTKILNALSDLEKKIDSFEKNMTAMFKRLESKIEFNDARNQINDKIVSLDGIKRVWEAYLKAVADGDAGQTKALEDRLAAYDPTEIHESVVGIYHSLVHTDNPASINLFNALYDITYGDMNAIINAGMTLMSYATFGAQIDAFVSILKYKRSGEHADEDLANRAKTQAEISVNLYRELIDGMLHSMAKYKDKCVREMVENIKFKTVQIAMSLPARDSKELYHLRGRLDGELSHQWFWNRFHILLYDPVEGSENHYMGGYDYHFFKHERTLFGNTLNIVVKWADNNRKPVELRSWTGRIPRNSIHGLINRINSISSAGLSARRACAI